MAPFSFSCSCHTCLSVFILLNFFTVNKGMVSAWHWAHFTLLYSFFIAMPWYSVFGCLWRLPLEKKYGFLMILLLSLSFARCLQTLDILEYWNIETETVKKANAAIDKPSLLLVPIAMKKKRKNQWSNNIHPHRKQNLLIRSLSRTQSIRRKAWRKTCLMSTNVCFE